MILHWLSTGWRSLVANPLFSLLTIASLSLGCCGALLAGANIKQHVSFDRWVSEGERIFIITRRIDETTMGPGMRIDGVGIRRPNTGMPAPLKGAIEGQFGGLEMQARMFRGASLLPTDPNAPIGPPAPGEPPRPPPPGSVYVDPEFFDLFGIEFLEGSAEALSEPNSILINQSVAQRLFGEASPMNQSVEGAQKRMFRILGVFRDLPAATHLRFEAISSMRTLEQIAAAERASTQTTGFSLPSGFETWNSAYGGGHYLKMAAGQDGKMFASAARQAIQTAADEGAKQNSSMTGPNGQIVRLGMPSYKFDVVPLLDIHMGGPDLTGMPSSGDFTMLATLAGAAIALLGVSAFNYVTLSLARSLRRRKEVAVRKILGADQGALVRHYLVESVIVTAISLAIGFILAQMLHPWFARTIGQPQTLFDLFDPAFLAASLIVFALLALAVGAYPAFYLANVRPQLSLGEEASPGRMSQVVTGGLMGLQISAASALLIIAITMGAQAQYIERRPLGFAVKDRYQVQTACPTAGMSGQDAGRMFQRCQAGTKQLLSQAQLASKPAYFNGVIVSDAVSLQPFGWSAMGEKLGEAAQLRVDTDFLQVMGANLLAGRFFDSSSAYDRALIEYNNTMQARATVTMRGEGNVMMMVGQGGPGGAGAGAALPPRPARVPVIITRAMLPLLGADGPDAAIGQQINMQPNSQFPFEIVGVVDDWHQRPLKFAVQPLIFLPAAANNAVIEVPQDQVKDLQDQLTQGWKKIVGDAPNARVFLMPLSQLLENTYRADYLLMHAVTAFALVAIVVAGMGVFGLAAFEMRRRVREIGVRKALGASPARVAGLVIGRALAFAAVATVIAWPIGFWIANEWLSGFVYRTNLGFVVLPVASVIVIAFVTLAVAFSAVRAAAIRPGLALRV